MPVCACCACECVLGYVCVGVCVRACVRARTYVCMNVHVGIHMHVCVTLCLCVCKRLCVFLRESVGEPQRKYNYIYNKRPYIHNNNVINIVLSIESTLLVTHNGDSNICCSALTILTKRDDV